MFSMLLMFIFYLPYIVGFWAVQIALLQSTNRRRMYPLSFARLAGCAAVGALTGCIVGLGVGMLVMFGPAYMAGDFIGLPWLTMLPALAIGICATGLTSQMLSRRLVLRAKPRHLYRASA
jgi:ABC-type antimicrobial peptide transport system permease subunit